MLGVHLFRKFASWEGFGDGDESAELLINFCTTFLSLHRIVAMVESSLWGLANILFDRWGAETAGRLPFVLLNPVCGGALSLGRSFCLLNVCMALEIFHSGIPMTSPGIGFWLPQYLADPRTWQYEDIISSGIRSILLRVAQTLAIYRHYAKLYSFQALVPPKANCHFIASNGCQHVSVFPRSSIYIDLAKDIISQYTHFFSLHCFR